MVVLHHGAVAGHVVGVGEGPAPLGTVVLRTHVQQVAVEEDGVTCGETFPSSRTLKCESLSLA